MMHIKSILKKNDLVYSAYAKIRRAYNGIYFCFSQELFTKKIFKKFMGYELDLNDPKTFNEKIQWIKLNHMTEDYIRCADKYELRNYIKEKFPNLDVFFPKVLKVYSDPREINIDELPNKFVLKCNHGCGFNFVCTDKSNVNEDEIKKLVRRWMNTKYEFVACESQYRYMKKVIYAEEFVEGNNEGIPIDYKLYCFNGEVKIILVCLDRCGDHAGEYHYLDANWEALDLGLGTDLEKTKKLDKPEKLTEMLETAKALASRFEFVRVDFFDTMQKPILSELTFTPAGGLDTDFSYEIDLLLGNWIKLKK